MLQDEQFNVEPWWKASVVVKVSTIVARQTGDLLAKKLYGPNPVFVQVLFQGFRKNLKPDFNRP